MPEPETAGHDTETLSDAEFRVRVCRQLDHIDTMVHELTQVLAEHQPLIDRAARWMNTGWRAWGQNGIARKDPR